MGTGRCGGACAREQCGTDHDGLPPNEDRLNR